MILDELILHDFGQYRGRNQVTLTPPSPEQPVILFGGMNGAGKTTLLDALQLCLFGPLARCSNREGLAYEQYLLNCIHRSGGVAAAAVEIAFRHMTDGTEQHYRIRRSWSRSGKGCRERFEVLRNHKYDPLATENWLEQVEEFIPARISHLFLFDGEKIEGYADARSSANLIQTAIHNLLGLDIVEKLSADLSVIERRRKLEKRDHAGRQAIEMAEQARDDCERKCEAQNQAAGEFRLKLERVNYKLDDLEKRYRKEGGHLYEQRLELEHAHSSAVQKLRAVEKEMREFAAGVAPLRLIMSVLERVLQQDRLEAAADTADETQALLGERDAALLELIAEQAPAHLQKSVREFLEQDRRARLPRAVEPYLHLGELARTTLRNICSAEMDTAEERLRTLLQEEEAARQEVEEAASRFAAVPDADALAELVKRREELRAAAVAIEAELRVLEVELDRLRRERERHLLEVERLYRSHAEAMIDQDDIERSIKHSARVRETLSRFREAMIVRHLARIEELVLDSFRQLLRKKTLVTSLTIDAETFQLRLTTKEGQTLTPDRLSAGERQLLAVSILWGLARASGRPLPAVIDTPLGRLDSSHRRRLITHYFPHASHQVVLLSTDEEITGGYLNALQPYVGRRYQLVFDESSGATTIQPGYFEERIAHVDQAHPSIAASARAA